MSLVALVAFDKMLQLLTSEVVSVHVSVHVPVGGAQVDPRCQVVGAVVEAVDVSIVSGVDPHGGAGQSVVKSETDIK